jgi:hypothetical protein
MTSLFFGPADVAIFSTRKPNGGQALGGSPHISSLENRFEEHEQVEVGPRQIKCVQHID